MKRFTRCAETLVRVGTQRRVAAMVYAAGHAGAGTRWATELEPSLPDEWGLTAALLPGREARSADPAATRIVDVADALARDIRSVHDGVPCVLYGQSLGGLVMFEVCRRLERSVLVVLGTRAPSSPRPRDEVGDDEQLLADLDRFGGVSEALLRDDGLRSMILRVLRADLSLWDSYAWGSQAAVEAPVIAMRGLGDPTTTKEEVMAWERATPASFHFIEVAGGHLPTAVASSDWVPIARAEMESW